MPIVFLLVFLLMTGFVAYAFFSSRKAVTEADPTVRHVTAKTTQRFIGFKDISDNMIKIDPYRYRAVLRVTGMNFYLKSQAEQEQILLNFLAFINSLRHPIQIFVGSMRLDVSAQLKAMGGPQPNEFMEHYSQDLLYNVARRLSAANLLRHEFYVIVPYDFEASQKRVLSHRKVKELARLELDTRIAAVAQGLKRTGLEVEILDNKGLLGLMAAFYNRERKMDLSQVEESGAFALYMTGDVRPRA